jgi:hypothetical protein
MKNKNTTTVRQEIREISEAIKALKEKKLQLQESIGSDRVKCHGDSCSGNGRYAFVYNEMEGGAKYLTPLCKGCVENHSDRAKNGFVYLEAVKRGDKIWKRSQEPIEECGARFDSVMIMYINLADTVEEGGKNKTWLVKLNGEVELMSNNQKEFTERIIKA